MDDKIKTVVSNLYLRYRNFILYGIIGAFSAGVDFGLYSLLCFFGIKYLISNIISVHCGIFCSFLLNRYYNFKVKDKVVKRFLMFYVIGLIGLCISEGMLHVMVSYYLFNKIISKLLTVVVVAIVQFFLNKLITFRQKTR